MMHSEAEELNQMLKDDCFTEDWLKGVINLRNESYIIYDEDGALINGRWLEKKIAFQKPGVRIFGGVNYAIYDIRYNKGAAIGKKYSEFVHELFHCYQLRMKLKYDNREMIEGPALFVECNLEARRLKMDVGNIIELYGIHMQELAYLDYYRGAKYMYEKFSAGYSWEDYFLMKM